MKRELAQWAREFHAKTAGSCATEQEDLAALGGIFDLIVRDPAFVAGGTLDRLTSYMVLQCMKQFQGQKTGVHV